MADITLAVTFADGTVLRSVGFIDIESWESESNKMTLSMTPRDNKWETFSGSQLDTHGTPRKVAINGVTYRALPDTNVSLIPSEFKNEGQPTSGGNTRKMTKQLRTLSGITIACNAVERETLRGIAEAL
ncbi:MAG: hypothetical protein IMZ69_06900 [Spirochaetes bacterium]|nr:hypothetical protein [Spirochaetota bacterium]